MKWTHAAGVCVCVNCWVNILSVLIVPALFFDPKISDPLECLKFEYILGFFTICYSVKVVSNECSTSAQLVCLTITNLW